MDTFNKELNRIYATINSFVFFGQTFINAINNEVVGINCSSSSILRKNTTLDKVKSEIDKHGVNIIVVDDQPNTKYFKLKLKK